MHKNHQRLAAKKPKTLFSSWLWWFFAALLPLLLVSVFFFYPVGALLSRGLSNLQQLSEILLAGRTLTVLTQTLLQASSATLIAVVLGIPAAYLLYCVKFRGQTLLRAVLAIPFVLPTVVVALAFNTLYGKGGALHFLGLDKSFLLVVLALSFFNISVVSRTVGAVWAGIDNRQNFAAATLGARPLKIFYTITLPQLTPAIGAAAALVFLYCATSFGIVFILGGRKYANLESEIYENAVKYLDIETAAALSLLQILVVVLAIIVSNTFNKRSENLPLTAQKPQILNTPQQKLLLAVTLLSCALLQLLPLAALLIRSLTRKGAFSLANYLELGVKQRTFSGSAFDAAVVSLQTAFIATLITLAIALPAAFVASRRPRSRWLRALVTLFDGLLLLPVGVSAVTLGFGLLITMHSIFNSGVDLRSSGVLIPVAQALVALPLVLRALTPVLRGINARQTEAAALLGAHPLRVLLTVELPHLKMALAVAAGFAFAVSLGEFGASSFLARPGMITLPVFIGQVATRPGHEAYGVAAAGAVLLAILCAVIMLTAERLLQKDRHD